MMRSTSSITKQRKHSKTFTGCWTCRARKVKCDEGKPACAQCSTKSLHCEGYGVRLQWMPSDQNASDRSLPRGRVQRSQIAYEPGSESLEASEIDDILLSIDAFDSDITTRNEEKKNLFIHSFGVFKPPLLYMESRVRSPRSSANDGVTSATTTEDEATLMITADDELQDDITLDDSSFFLGSVNHGLYISDGNPPLEQQQDFSSAFGPTTPLDQWFEDSQLILHESEERVIHEEKESPGRYQWRSLSDALIRQPSSSSLPEQEQLLMYHYSQRAVNLFCVIDNQKSPWKTIHLPRALQSIGQISVAGSTSPIRNALRHALLAVSAFSLSNDAKLRISAEESARWARKGTLLRGRAIELLKEAVTNDLHGKSAPKYKEFLATMLSMVTINVMSGETSTCGMHLDGALRFITQARAWKTKFSPKAVSLHRIYFYLRTIYDSTAPGDRAAPQVATNDVPRPLLLNPTDTASVVEVRPLAIDADAPKMSMQMSTYECIYGVPQNLLVLLSKSTMLIREVEAFREANGRAALPAELACKCDDLEQWVMDWAVEKELERCRIDGMGASSEIIRQSTYAFHNALIIYFAQHIRLLGHRYLQTYVQNVLESIEAIETIKTESQIMAAPNYWPAFIAASEAFSDGLQGRFKSWYDQVEVYGIEAVRSGICVLTEVWARGSTTGQDTTSRWKSVVHETGAHLMLS